MTFFGRRRPGRGGRAALYALATAAVLAFGGALAARQGRGERVPGAYADADLIGAGDIAWCERQTDEATAKLIAGTTATVFTVGDNAYHDGTLEEFRRCYQPSWGAFLSRTRPTPGNHDYQTPGAAGYFAYFGERAGTPGEGWYSYELDGWHVVVLNSNLDLSPGSPQMEWLEADLAAHPARCTLGYWHHPLVSSSGMHRGGDPRVREAWRLLREAGAELVLSGHHHGYERFAPMTPEGKVDHERGIRQFVIGTGGAPFYEVGPRAPHSETQDNRSHGVLALSLEPDGYSWEFVPTEPSGFRDRGTGSCH